MSHAATLDTVHAEPTATGIPNKKILMWAFLASDCMFFGALISTHLIYRIHPPAGSPVVNKVFSIELTSFSTFILLMSSLLMALAVNAVEKNQLRSTRQYLLGTIFSGLIFLGCQVYEFNHFVTEKHVTLSNSVFGSTFYTLTGTHGCHVAIGVLWLILMYVRSFKPARQEAGAGWLWRTLFHLAVFLITIPAAMASVLALVHTLQSGHDIAAYSQQHAVALLVTAAGLSILVALARRGPAVADFNEGNAIDVESMGLYWHFVDIVWIVIFTAVYLIEFL